MEEIIPLKKVNENSHLPFKL